MKFWLSYCQSSPKKGGLFRNLTQYLVLPFMVFFSALANSQDEMLDMGLTEFDDLMNIEVVSSSKFKQDLADVTSSMYIITAEEIKASGASDLPSLLKQVPGLFVAEVSSNSWAMGIRGFSSVFSNKMLVMIDGRSLFSPVFSGVFWEQLDLFLPDIERIEVIRGVGSTVWGANAVNGVVNIITKSTLDNENTHFYAKVGTHVDFEAGLRFGADMGEHSFGRGYIKSKQVGSNDYPEMYGNVDDSWDSDAGGFKWEHYDGPDSLFLSSDFIDQNVQDTSFTTARATTSAIPLTNRIYNVSAQWQRQIDVEKAFSLSGQVQSSERDSYLYSIEDDLFNIDFDTNFKFNGHQIVLGAGARRHDVLFDSFPGFATVSGDNINESRSDIFSAYIQDEWRFSAEHSFLLGTKFESHVHEDLNGDFRYKEEVWLPTLRYRYDINADSRLWMAVSRSARIPSIAEHAVKIPLFIYPPFGSPEGFPWATEVFTSGNADFVKEELLSYELGLRADINMKNRIELAVFRNVYDDVRTFVFDSAQCVSGQPFPLCPPGDMLVIDNNFTNLGDMRINGLEFSWLSRLHDELHLNFHYIWMAQSNSPFTQGQIYEEATRMLPKHQVYTQANWQFSEDLNFFVLYKYIGHIGDDFLPILAEQDDFANSYHSLDITATYQLSNDIHLTLAVENLSTAKKQRWTSEFPNSLVSLIDKRLTLGLDIKF